MRMISQEALEYLIHVWNPKIAFINLKPRLPTAYELMLTGIGMPRSSTIDLNEYFLNNQRHKNVQSGIIVLIA